MSLTDNILKTVSKNTDDRDSRSNRIKARAGLILNIFAALLAFNTYIGGHLNSVITNNTIQANDIWVFYQGKSAKQTAYELARDTTHDPALKQRYAQEIKRYESDPATGEGKRELYAQAKRLEAERDLAKKKSPWISYAGTAFQLSIVILSTSILSASFLLFYTSFGVAGIGILLMTQGIWLWMH
jgi:hypothetical protein